MKKLIIILLFAIGLNTYSQETLRKGFVSIQNNDTVWMTYSSGVWTLESDTALNVNLDTLYFSDGTYQVTSGGGSSAPDSLLLNESGDSVYVTNGTLTGNVSAEFNNVEANTTKTDVIQFSSSGSTLNNIPQNDIFMWDSTNSNYEPYASYNANSFYYGTTTATGITRLTYDGKLYATGLSVFNGSGISSQSSVSTPIQGNSYGTGVTAAQFISNADNITASFNVANWSTTSAVSSNVVEISRSQLGTGDITGNIIDITDNPTTTGTVSGAVLSATIDGTERISLNPRATATSAYTLDTKNDIDSLLDVRSQGVSYFKVTKDTTYSNNSVKATNITSETQTLAGTTLTGVATSKDVMENTETDSLTTETIKYTPLATEPTTPTLGMVYVNSTDNHIYYYNGTLWVQLD